MPLTITDVAKFKDTDKEVGLIEENLHIVPELAVLPVRSIPGFEYFTVMRTGVPTTGFRAPYTGVAYTPSAFTRQTNSTQILSGHVEIDKAVAAAWDSQNPELPFEDVEASGVMMSQLQTLGRQIFNTVDATNGFPGLNSFAGLIFNAGGTTVATSSSIYLVSLGTQGVHVVFGGDHTFQLGDFYDQSLTDGSGNKYAGRVADLTAWTGLQLINPFSVCRITNVTADTSATCTDNLIAQALELFPIGQAPDYIFMSKRSRRQLQESRSKIASGTDRNAKGTETWAPTPLESNGIPLIATGSIGVTEALVVTATSPSAGVFPN